MNKNNKHLRQKAQKTGRHAETLAAWVLRLKGYRISAGKRSASSPTQWQRIGAAAQAFVARHKGAQEMVWRFDFIGMGRF